MASARASVRRALSTCRASIMRPSTVTTPRPSATAAVKASMTRRAAAISSVGRRPGVVAGLDLAGMDERLAVEAHLDALAALGGEALLVVDVVEHPVEDRHARLASARTAVARYGVRLARPGHAERHAQLTGEVVGADHEHADARVGGDGAGFEDRRRRLDHRPDGVAGAPRCVEPGDDVVDVGGAVDLGITTADGRATRRRRCRRCPTAWRGRCSEAPAREP